MTPMKSIAYRAGLLAAILIAAVVMGGWAGSEKDLLVGNWGLDRGKSEYFPDTTLQRRSVTIDAKDNGIHFLMKTVTERGNTVEAEFSAMYDGKDVPISGSQLDTVALKRVDASTVERTGKIAGKVVENCTMSVSKDGKTMTMVTKGAIDGEDYNSKQVFTRQ